MSSQFSSVSEIETPSSSEEKEENGQSLENFTASSSEKGEENEQSLEKFKKFDSVKDTSDHYYHDPNRGFFSKLTSGWPSKQNKTWAKKIQKDWCILEKDLPDSIYVRVYEERMDLMRAVIIGPPGTPYHDGLFFFDIRFPSNYPNSPPKVYYYSFGLRPNPNLYGDGTVCLSLLNTWWGRGVENWNPFRSTILQILLSIQALVLNSSPFFNEPGYEKLKGTPDGDKMALAYNENTFLLSCKTMLYLLKKPPKHFEAFVQGHFRERADSILGACKAYMNGTQVGCLAGNGVQNAGGDGKSSSKQFRDSVGQLVPLLVTNFARAGADDMQKYLAKEGELV